MSNDLVIKLDSLFKEVVVSKEGEMSVEYSNVSMKTVVKVTNLMSEPFEDMILVEGLIERLLRNVEFRKKAF